MQNDKIFEIAISDFALNVHFTPKIKKNIFLKSDNKIKNFQN